MSVEIESRDIVRIVLQYLKENHLLGAYTALQAETGIALNTVDNMDSFLADIKHGNWDVILTVVAHLKLPTSALIDLYEQVLLIAFISPSWCSPHACNNIPWHYYLNNTCAHFLHSHQPHPSNT